MCVKLFSCTHMNYQELTSTEKLFQAFLEFRKGKRKRKDIQEFERNLEDNLFDLQSRLRSKTYKHGSYYSFYVQDPKQRHIHKAQVSDRVVHHLLYMFLYEIFDKTFIYDSYSCRLNKGTHKGVKRLEKFARIVSKNYTKPCWALKLDIRKFFVSVDHQILINLLQRKVKDLDILWLLKQVIGSFPLGIPLGNLTSQVFANIYLNQLDQLVKHQLKIKYYLRYADDFLILGGDKQSLERLIVTNGEFLERKLNLKLHSQKIIFRKLSWGIDFLGYVVLPHYILPRTKTKKRIFKNLKLKLDDPNFNQTIQSYLGYLKHSSSFKLTQRIKNEVWFNL